MTMLNQFWTQIAPLAITGAIVSLLTQWIKQYVIARWHGLATAVVLSFIGALILIALAYVPANLLIALAGVFGSANTVYLLIIQWFETSQQPPAQTEPAQPVAAN